MGSLTKRIGSTTNRIYPRFTYDAADELVRRPTAPDFAHFAGRRYCTVVSFRRDGRPVATPVWFGLGDGKLYFRSLAEGYKLKRIAANPRVLVAPCSRLGKPTGDPVEGVAAILDPAGEATAERRIQDNFGLLRKGYESAIAGAEARYVEIVPAKTGR